MERELITTVLQAAHPPHAGWKQLGGQQLIDDVEIDFVFFKKGKKPVAVLLMETPYVSGNDLRLAKHIQDLYQQKMNGRQVRVMLVYRDLLVRPQKVPPGISILSITEWTDAKSPLLKN